MYFSKETPQYYIISLTCLEDDSRYFSPLRSEKSALRRPKHEKCFTYYMMRKLSFVAGFYTFASCIM